MAACTGGRAAGEAVNTRYRCKLTHNKPAEVPHCRRMEPVRCSALVVRRSHNNEGFGMHLTKLALAAAAAAFLAVGSASAAPLVSSKLAIDNSSLIEVQHRVSPHHRRHAAPPPRRHVAPPHRHSRHYVPGRRYSTAPRGWHRHHARPGDWQRRGCVMVGPVWFCP